MFPIPLVGCLFFLLLFAQLHKSLNGQCAGGCCDGGCCGGCCDCGCGCGCGPTIQIQLPQRNQSQPGGGGGNQQAQGGGGGNGTQQGGGGGGNQQGGGGGGQQGGGGGTAMNDQIPKMVAEMIAQDIIGKINDNGKKSMSKEEEEEKEKEESTEKGNKKSRPKAKSKGDGDRRRDRRQAVWPMGGGHVHQQQQQPEPQQLNEEQLEQKFQQIMYLQQRPLMPLQAEPPPLEPPEFPLPAHLVTPSEPTKSSKTGPLRVIHVKPTSVGSFTLVEGQFEIQKAEDSDLKHPFEEPFQ